MNLKNYFQFIEIKTKLASVIPFSFGVFYTFYLQKNLNFKNTTLFFISMICFDMFTTGLNNYLDFKRLKLKPLFENTVSISILLFLIITSLLTGLFLVYNTGLPLLFLGAFCFLIGIFYSFGFAPISHTPYGEIFSGLVMGFCIPFITLYINMKPNYLVEIFFRLPYINININILNIIYLFLVTVPIMCSISNIMLANNICDLKEDILVKRYTLPYYLGLKKSLLVFNSLYYISYITIIFLIIFKLLPFITILSLLTFPLVKKNVLIFNKLQSKSETFSLSIKNFILLIIPYIASIAVGGFFRK